MRNRVPLNRDGFRHLVMRLGLGFVTAWFGLHELQSPSEWSVFVPSFVGDISPLSIDALIVLHGFLLLLASVAIVLGLFYLPGCLLGIGLLSEIIFGLWYDGGLSDLVVRDIGLLALACASAVDRSRYLHLETVLSRAPTPAGAPAWCIPASVSAAGIAMVAAVVVVGAILYGTGNTETIPDASAFSLTQSTPGPTPPPLGSVTPATPAPTNVASSIRFDSWRFAQYSYEIYPGPPNSDAQKALAGFQLNIQDKGDKVLVQLKATSSRYKDLMYTVNKGDTAYFVETTMRDDPSDQEQNLGDDGVVAVNPQGYLLGS